jgi:hypothetical protein
VVEPGAAFPGESGIWFWPCAAHCDEFARRGSEQSGVLLGYGELPGAPSCAPACDTRTRHEATRNEGNSLFIRR